MNIFSFERTIEVSVWAADAQLEFKQELKSREGFLSESEFQELYMSEMVLNSEFLADQKCPVSTFL